MEADDGLCEAPRAVVAVEAPGATPRPHALLLRGAPGVGKSTVGGLLVRLGVAGRVIEVDVIRGARPNVNWSDREQHAAALVTAAELAVEASRESPSRVVVVDTFGRDSAAAFADRLRQAACHPIVVGLWARPQVLLRRLDERKKRLTRDDYVLPMNSEVERSRSDDGVILDTSDEPPEETARRVAEIVVAHDPDTAHAPRHAIHGQAR